MKKTSLILLLAIIASLADAVSISLIDTTTVRTNPTTSTAYITIPGVCTNKLYTVTNPAALLIGDPLATAFQKVNTNLMLLATNPPVLTVSNTPYGTGPSVTYTGTTTNGQFTFNFTLPAGAPGASGTNATLSVTNTLSLSPYSQPTATNLGDGTVAVLQFGIPVVPTNVVLSVNELIGYQTNSIVWGTSNYIGSVPGISSLDFNGGDAGPGGMTPNTNINQNVNCSTNGGTSWFTICTNGGGVNFTTTNACLLSVAGAGGGLGYLTVRYLDYPDAAGRTNGHYAGVDFYPDPTLPQQPATKNYTDTAIANALGSSLTTIYTNGAYYATLQVYGTTIWQAKVTQVLVPKYYSISGTNLLMSTAATNLPAGWQLTSTTNLSLNFSFATFTNYTLATNSGIATFTIPIIKTELTRFFRLSAGGQTSMAISAPLSLLSVLGIASNLWSVSYAAITNMPAGSSGLASSNGIMVKWTYTNGVVAAWPW